MLSILWLFLAVSNLAVLLTGLFCPVLTREEIKFCFSTYVIGEALKMWLSKEIVEQKIRNSF